MSEASFSRDDAKAVLLEDAVGRDVVVRDTRVERARLINGQERGEGGGRDPFAPVGAADPVRDLRSLGSPHDPIVPATSPSTTIALAMMVSSALSLDQRRSKASRSM